MDRIAEMDRLLKERYDIKDKFLREEITAEKYNELKSKIEEQIAALEAEDRGPKAAAQTDSKQAVKDKFDRESEIADKQEFEEEKDEDIDKEESEDEIEEDEKESDDEAEEDEEEYEEEAEKAEAKKDSDAKRDDKKAPESKFRHKVISKEDKGTGISPAVWKWATAVLAVLLLISIVVNAGVLGSQSKTVANKAVSYINNNLLSSGSAAKLDSIKEVGGVYQLKLNVDGQQYDSYITKDGKLLFPSGINMNTYTAPPSAPSVPSIPSGGAISVSADDDPSIGPANAPVTIVEFSDFQCPFCARAEPAIKQVLDKYKDQVRFVYRDFPLSFHPYAQKAAEASECADEQGKYWEFHDLLFNKQSEWSSQGYQKFKEYAASLGMDAAKFNNCLDSGKYADEIKKDFEDGQKYGVSGTPAFFINGQELSGAQPFSEFQKLIDAELKKVAQ